MSSPRNNGRQIVVGIHRVAVVVTLGLLLVSLLPATGVAIEDPEITAFAPSPRLEPGETATLTVQLLNEDRSGADPVATAENLRATLEAGDSPVAVQSGTIVVGDIPDGEAESVDFQVRVPAGATPGEYELPVELTFVADDEEVDREAEVTVRIERAPRFEVVSTRTTASVGDRGTLAVVLANTGSEAASDVTVTLAETYVGRAEPGEQARVAVRRAVAEGAAVRPYAIGATVEYEDADGVARSRSVPVSVTPLGDTAFAVDGVEGDLRVGEQGTITAAVENVGNSTARDAAVSLAVPWANGTDPASYPVGDLAPGESAEVRFSTLVPAGIDPGVQRVTFTVDHATRDGARRLSEPLSARVDLEPRRSPVAVEPVNATFEVDTEGRLDVRLTNRADGPITDLRATLSTTEPITSDDPTAYVSRLDAGESTVVSFHVDVASEAVPGEHPVAVSLAYDDANGNARIVRDVPVGVTVVEPAGPDFPVAPAAAIAVAVVAGAVWWYRRR